jgi:hypothetical protein
VIGALWHGGLSTTLLFRAASSLLLVATLVYLWPAFSGAALPEPLWDNMRAPDGPMQPFLRSARLAVLSALACVALGLVGASFLAGIRPSSAWGGLIAVALLPFALGNMAAALVVKLLVSQGPALQWVIEDTGIRTLFFLVVTQVWQFGLLFLYLFYLTLDGLPQRRLEFARAMEVPPLRRFADFLLPPCRDLAVLLLLVGFVFSFYELAISQHVLKASRGLRNELISHWLQRVHRSNLLYGVDLANEETFSVGLVVASFALGTFLLVAVLSHTLVGLLSRPSSLLKKLDCVGFWPLSWRYQQRALALVIAASAAVPVSIVLFSTPPDLTSNLPDLSFAMGFAGVGAGFATALAIALGTAVRLGWTRAFASLNRLSLGMITGLFLLLLVPPIVIAISGFVWMRHVGYGATTVYVAWLLGHAILILPILGSFVVILHFRVSSAEIEYLQSAGLHPLELVHWSFLRRFRLEYLLTFLVGASIIWNEATLNRIMSDWIPSFAARMEMLYAGRGADYSKATSYLLAAATLAGGAIALWEAILVRYRDNQDASP